MRTDRQRSEFRAGRVHGRIQWAILGAAIGVLAAVAVAKQTGWILRSELALNKPVGRPFVDQVMVVEAGSCGQMDSGIVQRSQDAARSRNSDVPLQLAAALVQATWRSPERQILLSSLDRTDYAPGDSERYKIAMLPDRINGLSALYSAYPHSPLVPAAALQELIGSTGDTDRPECNWLWGKSVTTQFAGHVRGMTTRSDVENGAKDKQAQLSLVCAAAFKGIACDPDNAFFYMSLAYARYESGKDAEALDAVYSASRARFYDDYEADLAGGWLRLDEMVYGALSSVYRLEISVDLRGKYQSAIQTVGCVTIWKAILLEHEHRNREGLALRTRIARLGALRGSYRPNGFSIGRVSDLVVLSGFGAGGMYVPKIKYTVHKNGGTENSSESATSYASRIEQIYLKYLGKHGSAALAGWYEPVFKAQDWSARDASAVRNGSAFSPSYLNPELGFAAGSWLLAEICLFVLLGLALSVIVYRHRFALEKEVFLSRAQWGLVFAGCFIAVLGAMGSEVIYTDSSLLPLALVVLPAASIALAVQRRNSGPDMPAVLLVRTICACIGILALLFVSLAVGHIVPLMMDRSMPPPGQTWLSLWVAYALPLLILPAAVLFYAFVKSRVRYQAVPTGLYRGMRRAILPVLSVLLLVWSASIAVTAAMDKDYAVRFAADNPR